jgi:hypothetical protein
MDHAQQTWAWDLAYRSPIRSDGSTEGGDSKSMHDGFAPLSGMDNGGRIRSCFIKAALSSGGVIQRQPPAPAALQAPDSARCTPAVVIAARRGHSAALDGVQMGPKTVPLTTPRRVNSSRPWAPQHPPTTSDRARCRACWPSVPRRDANCFFSVQPRALSDHGCSRGCPEASRAMSLA